MLSYGAFFPSHVCWLQYDLTQLFSWRANSTACQLWSCQLVHVSLFGRVPVHLLATALMHVPRCWLLATLSLLTSVPSLFISSRLFSLNLFPTSCTLLVSEIFIYVACKHVNWLEKEWCLQRPFWCCFRPDSRDMGYASCCCLSEHLCFSFTSHDRCAFTCMR